MTEPAAFVVTGASPGIGRATVRALLAQGRTVYGSVRREADAALVSGEATRGAFVPLIFDVTNEAAVASAAARVSSDLGGRRLAGLVNNAGIAIGGPLAAQPMAEIRAQVDVNLFGPLIVTRAFLPLLGSDAALEGPPGRIVNMSSVGGRLAPPFLGAYVATKHALEGLSDSLRRELLPFGIDVVIIGPGSVHTPIWDKAEAQRYDHYVDTPYAAALQRFRTYAIGEGRKGYPPERVADVVVQALTAPKPKTRYAVVKNRLVNWSLPLVLPRRVVDRLIASQLGLGRA